MNPILNMRQRVQHGRLRTIFGFIFGPLFHRLHRIRLYRIINLHMIYNKSYTKTVDLRSKMGQSRRYVQEPAGTKHRKTNGKSTMLQS